MCSFGRQRLHWRNGKPDLFGWAVSFGLLATLYTIVFTILTINKIFRTGY